jgi:hypothetical protein
VRSSIRGNAAVAKSRCLSQLKKRYVTSWATRPVPATLPACETPNRSSMFKLEKPNRKDMSAQILGISNRHSWHAIQSEAPSGERLDPLRALTSVCYWADR